MVSHVSIIQTHTLLSLCSFLFCLLLECSSSVPVVRVIKNAFCSLFSPRWIHTRIQDMCSKLSKDQQQKGWPGPSLLAERDPLAAAGPACAAPWRRQGALATPFWLTADCSWWWLRHTTALTHAGRLFWSTGSPQPPRMRLAKGNVDCAGSVTPQSILDAQGKVLPRSSPHMQRTDGWRVRLFWKRTGQAPKIQRHVSSPVHFLFFFFLYFVSFDPFSL